MTAHLSGERAQGADPETTGAAPVYPGVMTLRLAVLAACLLCSGCLASAVQNRLDCHQDVLDEWDTPAGWYVRELSPTQAEAEVRSGNIPFAGIEERWRDLRDQWQPGDQYWLYRRPSDPWISSVGSEEGIVLNRGCDQLGFVTTSVAEG